MYVGAGKSAANPEAIIAYSPSDMNGRAVAFADGSVQVLSAEKFQEALQRDAALPRVATAVNAASGCPGSACGAQPASAPSGAPGQPPAQPGGPAVIFANGAACRSASRGSGRRGGLGGGDGRRRLCAAPQAKAHRHGRAAHPHRGAAHRPGLHLHQSPQRRPGTADRQLLDRCG